MGNDFVLMGNDLGLTEKWTYYRLLSFKYKLFLQILTKEDEELIYLDVIFIFWADFDMSLVFSSNLIDLSASKKIHI